MSLNIIKFHCLSLINVDTTRPYHYKKLTKAQSKSIYKARFRKFIQSYFIPFKQQARINMVDS